MVSCLHFMCERSLFNNWLLIVPQAPPEVISNHRIRSKMAALDVTQI